MKNENDKLLESLLNGLFLDTIINQSEPHTALELNITPDCNQACEYCYLVKHGNELYPKEIRDPKQILKNTDLLLTYLESKGAWFRELSIYSGEIGASDFAKQFFDILYSHLEKYPMAKYISIPSNMSFLLQDEYAQYYQDLIDKFLGLNIEMYFSASIDGKIVDNTIRSRLTHTPYSDDFYDRVFKFCKKHEFGFHPMISALDVNQWIDNYSWFMEKFNQYGFSSGQIMMLEVRDNNGTPEAIENYVKYLEFEVDWLFNNSCNSNPDIFAQEVINYHGHSKLLPANIILNSQGCRYTCGLQTSVTIRLGDLVGEPCHRTSYPQFNFGQFIVENDKITSLHAFKPELAARMYLSNPLVTQIGCDTCSIKQFCVRGCLGTQYEETHNLFIPCETVCNLEHAKIRALIHKYKELGIGDCLIHKNYYEMQDLLNLDKAIEKESNINV